MSSEAQIKSEIARLTASINQHKSNTGGYAGPGRGRGGIPHRGGYRGYGHDGYNDYSGSQSAPGTTNVWTNKYVRPGLVPGSTSTTPKVDISETAPTTPDPATSEPATASGSKAKTALAPPSTSSTSIGKKEVVLNGVAFESSARSLVRKDRKFQLSKLQREGGIACTQAEANFNVNETAFPWPPIFIPVCAEIWSSNFCRPDVQTKVQARSEYDPEQYAEAVQARERLEIKKLKYLNKPCPQFTTTGACNRGLTCMYQHDPSKIAICWNFLQDNCTNTAETCNLSHDPTPERTPLCLHFLNKGRCTRGGCPFPHVNMGKRDGVCRDFAVLGYCEKGLDCDKQHVRECPDFAERATCGTKGCKLPHVIRANRGRKAAPAQTMAQSSTDPGTSSGKVGTDNAESSGPVPSVSAEDGQLGDEYISLTFNETESEEEEESSSEEGDGSDEEGDDAESSGGEAEDEVEST